MGRTVAILIALASSVTAQTPAGGQPASLSGSVTNSVTGEPVLRAHIAAQCEVNGRPQGMTSFGTQTDAKGEFSLTQLPAATCSVSAQRVGFVPSSAGNNYELASGTHKDGVKLTLTPAGAITGRVLDGAGEPVEGATVGVEMGGHMNENITTDDLGRFRLGGLRPGKYRVKAVPQSFPFPPEIRSDGTVEAHYASTYYPEALNAQSAQRVEVKAGAEASGIDIHLVRTPIVTVSGKVTGIPAGLKNVMVSTSGESWNGPVRADGTFALWRLDPGKYTLVAQSFSGQPQLKSTPLEIEVGTANLEHLELRMIPPFEVSGQVRFEDEQSRQPRMPPSRPGQPPPRPPQRMVMLRPAAGENGEFLRAPLGADDSFTIEKVHPERYRVGIVGGSGYVRSVRIGMAETEGDILDVRNGSSGTVTLSISSNFAEVSGTVSDSKGPVEGATVVLAPPDGDMSRFMVERTDSSGVFKFRTAPGKYKLAPVGEGDVASGFNSQTMEDYKDIAISMDLAPGDKVTQDLKRRQ